MADSLKRMLRPLSLLPALVVVATILGGAGVPAPGVAAAPADPDAPLAVTIDELSESAVPEQGPITIRGSVTNVSDEPWSTINMYPFVSDEPLTTRRQLAEASQAEPTAFLGERIGETPYDTIDQLEPGQSASYVVRVRSQDLEADTPGVYWFGIHALGETSAGRDATADGRARTFLPKLNGTDRKVKTALVLPLRASISHQADGSIDDPPGWTTNLAPDGRLGALVEAGEAAGNRDLTWLVDPAVTDAVTRLAANNPARSLAANVDPEATEDPDAALADPEDPTTAPPSSPGTALPSTPETTAPEDEEEEPEAEVEEPTAADRAASRAATAWLDRLGGVLTGSEVLALPYGDLDVSAAATHDPTSYAWARQRSGDALQPWGLPVTPALGGPRGYLSLPALQLAAETETVIGSDQMLAGLGTRVPTVVSVDGRRLVLASTAAASGGPGPDDPYAGVAMRQRILAEVAVRRMTARREPLVVMLPSTFAPADPEGFFEGLDQPWLDLTTVADVADEAATPVAAEDLVYPRFQARRELDAADFDSARRLTDAGRTLQYLLTRNVTVGAEVADEAASGLSYAHRLDAAEARMSNDRSRVAIESTLRGVEIHSPPQVTLTSASGHFSATLENTLDEPVTVRVRAVADRDRPITITMAEENVRLPPHSRRSVLLNASTESRGAHNITLEVTDMAGTALGSSDRLPIRAAQVSEVIWLIIATGAALLFGAIAARIYRRIRDSRRTPEPEPEPHEPAPSGATDGATDEATASA